MRKADLVERVAERAELDSRKAEAALDAMLEHITNALSRSESVAVTGFGAFSVKQRPARSGRNPQTGDAITIAASRMPSFKAGKHLKQQVADADGGGAL